MKRIFAVGLALIMLFGFAACKGRDNETGTDASDMQSEPVYFNSTGTVQAPDTAEIETDGTVTVSGKVKTENGNTVIELESVTSFIVSAVGGATTTYPDFRVLVVPNAEAHKFSDLKGLTVVVSGTLGSDGGAILYLNDIIIENVLEGE